MVVAMSRRRVYQMAEVIRRRIGTTQERQGDERKLLLVLSRYLDMTRDGVNVSLKHVRKEKGKSLVHCRLEHEHRLESTDAILLIEQGSMRVLYANTAAEQLYGYTNKEWLKKTVYNISVRDRDELKKELRAEFEGKSSGRISRHRLANGEIKPMSINVEPIEREGKKMLFCLIREAVAIAC